MKNALHRNFIREILKNKSRFLSIFFIVMLGTAFFAGVRSAGTDMKETADEFYKRSKMMDIRMMSSYGITEEDVADIQAIDGVEMAVGGYAKEVIVNEEDEQFVLRLIGITQDINELILTSGRMPESPDECVMDSLMTDHEIGDVIDVISGTEDDIGDSLNYTSFKIVGFGNLPYYLDMNRGVGSIGNGTIKAFAMVPQEAFCMEQYAECYISVKGAYDLNSYSDEYKDSVEHVSDRIKEIEDKINNRRHEDVVSDAQSEIDDAKTELEDAQKELDDAKSELDDGKKELDDAKSELDDAKTELADAKKEIDDGEKELTDSKKKLDDANKQLESSKKELDSAKSELSKNEKKLESAKKELDKAEKQLNEAKTGLDNGKKDLENSRKELDEKKEELSAARAEAESGAVALKAGWDEYNSGMASLDEQSASLDEAKNTLYGLEEQLSAAKAALAAAPENEELKAQVATLESTIAELKAKISGGESALEGAHSKLEAAYAELSEKQAAYDAGIAALDEAQKLLDEGEKQYQEGLAEYEKNYEAYSKAKTEYEKGKKEYESGLAQFKSGKKKYESGLSQYKSGEREYEEGLSEYNKGLSKWEDGKKEYDDGMAKYESGMAEYEDGKKEYEEGLAEYRDAYNEHMPEIQDGWKEVRDAEESLIKLEMPKLYTLDRDKVQSVISLKQDAERMDSLGNVFPVIFFLVAALVSLTNMTRLVDEQRQQIGTLKALGFSSWSITWNYLGYALIPSLVGGIIGVFLGEYILPKVIIDSYRTLYVSLDRTLTPFNFKQFVTAVVTAGACTGLAAWAACYAKLRERPASLMRPQAPASGRRVFLEHISPIWNRMNFTAKSTARNLFRYKKRLSMTIIGIGACMGLIIVGFGLYDSITAVAKRQYREIFTQEATVGIDSEASPEEVRELKATIDGMDDIIDSMELAQIAATLYKDDVSRSAIIYVPDEIVNIGDFLCFQDRKTLQPYDYPKEGVGLSEKTAAMLGVSVGDSIELEKGENEEHVTAQVAVIVENYVQHYCFMTKETYKDLFGEDPEYNDILINYEDTSAENESRLGKILVAQDASTSVNFTSDLQKQIDDMLQTLTKITWVLLVSAGLLAFVVLYSLNNINITERKRELATLKVLGFFDKEVAVYVYRENIFLTAFGIVLGCFLGKILHQFTILTVEVDLMMFGRNVSAASYIKSGLITTLFAVIINSSMYFSIKKIDMIESLKSVE